MVVSITTIWYFSLKQSYTESNLLQARFNLAPGPEGCWTSHTSTKPIQTNKVVSYIQDRVLNNTFDNFRNIRDFLHYLSALL